jgi:predicted RNA-binding Zn ribbon-like protein
MRPEFAAISLEVSEVLESTYRAALGASVPPQALERLKATLASHLARQGKMDDAAEPLPSADTEGINSMMARISELKVCTCPPH